MKTVVSHMLFLGVLILLVGLPSAFAQGPGEMYRTGWVPLELSGFNNCANEAVDWTGMHSLQVRVTPDLAGGLHLSLTESFRGTAVGVESGSGYVSSEVWSITENYPQSGVVDSQVTLSGTLISLDKDVPDLHFRFLLHITIDATGKLTSAIDSFKTSCPEAL